MVKFAVTILFLTLVFCAVSFTKMRETHLYPSMDFTIYRTLPKDFRLPTSPYADDGEKEPTRLGLENLRYSASGQFTETNIVLMLMRHPAKKIVVLDLREESHGYVNGYPISWKIPGSTWTNIGKTKQQIEKDEQSRLRKVFNKKTILLDPETTPLTLDVVNTMTEEQLVKRYGMDYVRIPITENHRPNDTTVDNIVSFIHNLPEDTWVHVHCHGGRGRTTTFTVMYDSIINAKKVSLEDILDRNRRLGGTDMYRKKPGMQEEKEEAYQGRLEFLKKFYAYASSVDTTKVTWSEWVKTNP